LNIANIDGIIHPTNSKVAKLGFSYDKSRFKFDSLFERAFDHLKSRGFTGDYGDFFKAAKSVRVPNDYCPTTPEPQCSATDYKYRQISGACNNLKYPGGGTAFSVYGRLLEPFYQNGCDAPTVYGKSGAYLPNARDIALKLFRHHETDSTTSSLFLFFGRLLL
jgi:hypothetical protein